MEEIFFAGTPLLEAVGLREPFVEELRATIRQSVQKAVIPMTAYARQYESFLPVLNVDPVAYVRSHTLSPLFAIYSSGAARILQQR